MSINPAMLTCVQVTGGSPVQVASWTRGAAAFRVMIRVASGAGPVYLGASSSAAQSGFRIDPGSPDVVLQVPASTIAATSPTETLWAYIQPGGMAYVSVAIDPS